MNSNSSPLQSQQYYPQDVPVDSIQKQQPHNNSSQKPFQHQLEQPQQTIYTEPVVKTENETQSGNASTAAKEADTKKKRAGPKRRKVTHACVYCRRSHMTCDDGRPCQRCIKRSIGHLCHDEPKGTHGSQQVSTGHNVLTAGILTMQSLPQDVMRSNAYNNLAMQGFSGQLPTTPLTFASEHMGHEFTVLTDFLESVDGNTHNNQNADGTPIDFTEKFLLTAADPSDGTSEDRLTQVINAKFEAGFLKPYNYVSGYARLQRYMENKQRILSTLGTFRPTFRNIAQSLTDIDLVLVEENFERLLLDYDRVFSSMGIPACLWRRTGEIYKGNKEFALLIGVPVDMLREGRLCIYELMMEDSAVNYWEKYGNIAFDAGQKAVLTSCLLKGPDQDRQNVISCCFSFTIRRDKYNMYV
ncbi:6755_t:CDS:2 [Funneliformis caledonium]|uniref:6755_t:CDS:1 n=1 Tax=Funneliformis caledonium TaxID=1117310 RepID=A0A9N8VW21_9GLOM|nr:6755_t:CDS:2 [Funneliformis caledonium]